MAAICPWDPVKKEGGHSKWSQEAETLTERIFVRAGNEKFIEEKFRIATKLETAFQRAAADRGYIQVQEEHRFYLHAPEVLLEGFTGRLKPGSQGPSDTTTSHSRAHFSPSVESNIRPSKRKRPDEGATSPPRSISETPTAEDATSISSHSDCAVESPSQPINKRLHPTPLSLSIRTEIY